MTKKIIYAVLAGGNSTRFSRDKRFSLLAGQALITYPITLLHTFSDDIYVVLKAGENQPLNAKIVNDKISNGGPLCGIYSLMSQVTAEYYLLLSADMPFVNEEMIKLLIKNIETDYDVFLFNCLNKWQPFPVIFSRKVYSFFRQRRCEGRKISDLFKGCPIKYVDWQKEINFFNVNRETDLERAKVIKDGAAEGYNIFLPTEEKYSIYFEDQPVFNISLTPHYLNEFIYGFMYDSGFIATPGQMFVEFREDGFNIQGAINTDPLKNGFTITSGCGGGKDFDSLNLKKIKNRLPLTDTIVKNAMITLMKNMYLHNHIGGYHGCGIFKIDGHCIFICEDIGRHNALDKCIGFAILNAIDLSGIFAVTTGRITTEIVKKCLNAGISFIGTRSAVSRQSLTLANKFKLRLACYIKAGKVEFL